MSLRQSVFAIALIALIATCRGTEELEIVSNPDDWAALDTILQNGIDNGAFPGCVALVASKKGVLYAKAFGNFTYGIPPPLNNGQNPPMTLQTRFDMASCTKVTATLSAVAQFYERGELSLDSRVADILPGFDANGKGPITILNCLLHNAGFPADPDPNYYQAEFGCPETRKYHPLEDFSCQKKEYYSLLSQTLANPIGQVYIYSDLSFMTLGFVVGTLAKKLNYVTKEDLIQSCYNANHDAPETSQCYYEAYVRKYVFSKLGMSSTMFLPPRSVWPQCAPCENDTTYLHRVIQGQVSDGNAYSAGGIAGHAGLFSTAPDVYKLMKLWLFPDEDLFLNQTTISLFIKEYNHSQSSRALGWNTNDPGVFDYGWNRTCGELSPKTFMHLGYTGTQVCGDPDRKVLTVFLTNRVYPSSSNLKIERVRQEFNTAVANIFDQKIDNAHNAPPHKRRTSNLHDS